MREIKFLEEKRAITLLKYTKVVGFIYDRSAESKGEGAVWNFWTSTWKKDFVADNGTPYIIDRGGKLGYRNEENVFVQDEEATKVWKDILAQIKSQAGKKLNTKKVEKLYALRDQCRLPAADRKIPEEINKLAQQKGLKIWRSDNIWKLSGFRIMRDKKCVAGFDFDLTQAEMIGFVEKY